MKQNERKRRVLALGECMVELRQSGPRALNFAFAGDTLNSTIYLRRLLPPEQFDVAYVTAIGDDHVSDDMLAFWQAEGIATNLVRRFPGELPGLYWIRTDPRGERSFQYWRSVSAARKVLADDYCARISAELNAGDLLLTSGISFAILSPEHRERLLALFAELRARGVKIAFDSNYRQRLWESVAEVQATYLRILEVIDTLITSHEDEAAMFGDADIAATVERINATSVPETVIRGAPGVTITRHQGELRASPIDPASVVDTTGAGDSFDGGYFAASLHGASVPQSIAAGHALAAIVVQHNGAIIPAEKTPSLGVLLQGNANR